MNSKEATNKQPRQRKKENRRNDKRHRGVRRRKKKKKEKEEKKKKQVKPPNVAFRLKKDRYYLLSFFSVLERDDRAAGAVLDCRFARFLPSLLLTALSTFPFAFCAFKASSASTGKVRRCR